MITTITINPAIDKTISIDNFTIDEINRIQSSTLNAGGKGINVSKTIHSLGGETTALAIVGGSTGTELVNQVKKYGFFVDFVWVDENTRTNIKIVDLINNTCTDINEKGPFINNEILNTFKEMIATYSKKSDALVLAGNAQETIPSTIYKDIISKNKNIKIFLDTSGDFLKEGIKSIPFFIKPNVAELSEMIGRKLSSIDEVIQEGKKLLNTGIEYVCISMGKEGLLLLNNNEIIKAIPPEVVTKSTVGAGDSVVGCFANEVLKGKSNKEALKLACAVSAASVTIMGTEVPSKKLIHEIFNNVQIFDIY